MQDKTIEATQDALASVIDVSGKSILEIGCGEGELASHLSKLTGKIVAIDPDEDSIATACGNYPDIDFRIGSGCNLDFADKTFDFVLFTLSLHHQDSVLALGEAERVVKTNGRVVVIEPVIGGDVNSAFRFVHNEDADKQTALDAIHSCGLEVTEYKEFSTEYIFDNKFDLYNAVFSYYGKEQDSAVISEINNFFREKIDVNPFSLIHLSHIFVLAKPD